MQLRFDGLFIWSLLLLAAIFSGCAPRSTPPGADLAVGQVEQESYVFLHWKEGLRLMIWHIYQCNRSRLH
jgi:hypothetical protein